MAVLAGGLALFLAAVCLNGAAAIQRARAAPKVSDPPLLVPWHRVGDISLGEAQARVQGEYGSPGHGFHVVARYKRTLQGYYLVHHGVVGVTFQNGRVEEIAFGIRYYRTKSGFGVGSKLPFGPCVRTWTHRCGHVWNGFVWNEWYRQQPCGCWTKVGLGKRSLRPYAANYGKPWFFIYVRHGHVDSFRFATKFVD